MTDIKKITLPISGAHNIIDISSLHQEDIIDNVTSTSTEDALSANMGRVLSERIASLESIGRYLSLWDCTTGLPVTDPQVDVYNYRSGDYYIVSKSCRKYLHTITLSDFLENGIWYKNIKITYSDVYDTPLANIRALYEKMVEMAGIGTEGIFSITGTMGPSQAVAISASQTPYQFGVKNAEGTTYFPTMATPGFMDTVTYGVNYRPSGSSYTKRVPSTVLEPEDVRPADVYFYDGTNWILQVNHTTGLVNDVKVDGSSVVVNSIAYIQLSPYRKAADQDLIDDELELLVTVETSNRQTADAELQELIEDEIENRELACATLYDMIEDEQEARIAADTTLQTNITNEASTRSNSDTILSGEIAGERTVRANADNALETSISNETTARINADTTLQTGIDAEATRASEAESGLSTAISTEKSRAETAEAGLTTTITTHTSNKNNPHSVTKAQVGLGNVDNKSEATIKSDFTGSIASGNAGFTTGGDVYSALRNKQDNLPSGLNDRFLHKNATTGALEWSEAGKIDDVKVNGTSVVTNKVANVIVPTKTSDITNDSGFITAAYHDDTKLNISDIVDNVTTTTTNQALSANMGKELNDRIEALKARGRFLSIWNATTGLPTTDPVDNPYIYKTGDYYIVGITGDTNYRPTGTTYTKTASTVVETDTLVVNDTYYYDGNGSWNLIHTEQPIVSFSTLAGSPYDNTNLTTALNAKVTGNADITAATHTKITYDTKGLVTGGSDLVASDIPNLDASKITTGQIPDARIESASTWSGKQDAISDLATIRSGAAKGATALQEHQSLAAYSTTEQMNTAIAAHHDSTKQDNLTVNPATTTASLTSLGINGTNYSLAQDPTEYTTKLQDDLYAYTPIGKITGASQTNPVKVADAGDPLKEVFNAILGTEVDVNPTITTTGTTFTKSGQTGTTTEGGGEVGKVINSQTGTVTWHVNNTATCSYGLKAGTTDTYSKTTATTFNYPIKTRSITVGGVNYNYQIAITYPALNGCTLSVTLGTLVKDDTTNRVLYCNVDANRDVKVSIAIPAGNSTTAAQTRFAAMTANVEYSAPQYNGVNVDNFWTYLKASYTAQGMTPPAQKSASSTAYTINAGAYYPYYMQSDSATVGATLSGCTQTTDAIAYTNGADYTISNTYFYFVIPNAKTYSKIQQYITGQFNDMSTTNVGTTTLTLNTGATATYKVFRTDALVLASKLKLRIV